MNITCTFNDLKTICKSASSPNYGGIVLYVKDPGLGVTYVTLLNTARLGIIFILSNTPTEANFLEAFPDAIKIETLS